ncbi:unnamed protein product [Cylindrotheca closterium]|uniref:Uncharacterized protein n=1 Tax=Cylindrotheca closterium TaxID=2856 RepID=A0AAD2CJ44_9STRA|nr:unnamed protein product [Cylindrotheca closterium]
MSAIDEFEAFNYEAPGVLIFLGGILRGPRSGFATSFADAFSDDLDTQRSYARGILSVAYFFLVLLVVWSFVLIVLKIKGDEVGCASGSAFHLVQIDNGEDELQETDSSSGDDSNGNKYEPTDEQSRSGGGEGGYEVALSDAGSDLYAESEMLEDQSSWATEPERTRTNYSHFSRMKETPLERKTRMCFLLCSIISLCTVPFILVFSFGPMKEATEAAKQAVLEAEDLIDSVSRSFGSVEEARLSSQAILDTMPPSLVDICPNIRASEMEVELGIDLGILLGIVYEDYRVTANLVDARLNFFFNAIGQLGNGSSVFNVHVTETESMMWMVPGLLFSISVLSAAAMFGSLLAWKKKSGHRLQMTMSYLVFPSLIIVALACWVVVALTSIGTMLTSDICAPDSPVRTPESTVYELLSTRNRDQNDTVYQFVDFYASGCSGSVDPKEYITHLERLVQEDIDGIWRQISIIDSIGRAKLIRDCGGDALVDFVTGSRNVAKLLTSMRRSLRSASGHLECDTLYPIYSQTVHEDLCTNTALASSYGFILFLILAITTSVAITLRASWLQSIGEEEKVFEDEDDIAENMVVDEHEEYLSYISQYKHEWQDYDGIDNSAASPREHRDRYYSTHEPSPRYASDHDDEYYEDETGREAEGFRTDAEGYQGSDECSEFSTPIDENAIEQVVCPAEMAAPVTMSPYDDVYYNPIDANSYGESEVLDVPQPMPPPLANFEYKQSRAQKIRNHASAPSSAHAMDHRGRREPEGQYAQKGDSLQTEIEVTSPGEEEITLHSRAVSDISSVTMDFLKESDP